MVERIASVLGFKSLKWCNCVYRYKDVGMVLIYIDDMPLFGKTKEVINEIMMIRKKIEIKDLGPINRVLGVYFERDREGWIVHQRPFVDEIKEKYKTYVHVSAKKVLPIKVGYRLSRDDCPDSEEEKRGMSGYPYTSLLGSLSYLASRSRPDVTFAVNFLLQFASNPRIPHWRALCELLNYVINTADYSLKLPPIKSLELTGYADANWASDLDDRHSTSGYIIFLDIIFR